MPKSVPWHHFESVRAELAAAGRRLLCLDNARARACLAMVAADDAQWVQPVFPVLADGELWLLDLNLPPRYRDLQALPQITLHTVPTLGSGDDFRLRGVAEAIHDAHKQSAVIAATEGSQGAHALVALYRVRIHAAMHTRWENRSTAQAWPNYSVWRS